MALYELVVMGSRLWFRVYGLVIIPLQPIKSWLRLCSYRKIHCQQIIFKLVINKEFKYTVLEDIKEILVVYYKANAQKRKRLGSFSHDECNPKEWRLRFTKMGV